MVAWQVAVMTTASAATLGVGSVVTHRLLRYRNSISNETLTEVLSGAYLERYRPMARLLGGEDLRYLESRPGYTSKMGARLRASRRRIFRMYLAELSTDFLNLHAAARRIVAEAPEQHADLVPVLLRQQVAFWRLLAVIELKLALSWGRLPVNAQGLLDLVNQLHRVVAVASPSASPA